MLKFFVANGTTALSDANELLESWDFVMRTISQTKFDPKKINLDDSTVHKSSLVLNFLKSLKKMQKTPAKSSVKKTQTASEIRTIVNANLDKKVIASDENQLNVLKRTAGEMKTLKQVGAHTKQLSSPEMVQDALLAIWPSLSSENADFQKNIFIEIYDRIGRTGIEQLTGQVGLSLRRFQQTFSTDKMIDFCFSNRGDVMEPFSPLWDIPHKLETFQVEAIELIDKGHSVVIGAPTSSGKTFVALYCIREDKVTLMLYPTDELAKQAAGSIRNQRSSHGDCTPIFYISGLETIQDAGARVIIGTPVDVFNHFMIDRSSKVDIDANGVIDSIATYGTHEHALFNSVRVKNMMVFDTIVVDEFQQLNNLTECNEVDQGCAMQQIMQLCPRAQFIVLSATIRNIDQVVNWIDYLTGTNNARSVTYNERFINQERWNFNGKTIEKVSCLSVVTVEMIQDGCLHRSEMQFPPKQLPRLGMLIEESIVPTVHPHQYIHHPHSYFAARKITLKSCKVYEDLLKTKLTQIARTEPEACQGILDHYATSEVDITSLTVEDLYKVLDKLKQKNMLSCMIFIFDQVLCKETCYELLKYMIREEDRQYPLWYELRDLQNSHAIKHRQSKSNVVSKGSGSRDEDGNKTDVKADAEDRADSFDQRAVLEFTALATAKIDHAIAQWTAELKSANEVDSAMLEKRIVDYQSQKNTIRKMTTLTEVNPHEPHPKFTFGKIPVTEDMMRSIKHMLNPLVHHGDGKNTRKRNVKCTEKKDDYRPPIGWKSQYMLCAERGFTFYTKYLRELDSRFQGTAQTMLEEFGIQLMFSDASYAYGVNLPITTVMFYNPTFAKHGMMDMSVILAHQAQGRGARRGLDTKGFVIYMGVRHQRLMLGEYLDIRGNDTISKYVTLPVMFNPKFNVARLSKLSMRQFYDLEDSTDRDQISLIETSNLDRLCTDIRTCYKEVTASPMQMFRLLRLTPYANLIQDFFSYTEEESYRRTLDFSDFDLVNALSAMMFPEIVQSDDVYKPSTTIDRVMPAFLQRCAALGKEYTIGKYSDLAVSARGLNADNVSMDELCHLKFVCDVLDVLCSNNKFVTAVWKDNAIKCHKRLCNLIFVMCVGKEV